MSALGSQRAEHPTDREKWPLWRLGVPESQTGSGDLLALSKVLVGDASAWHGDHYFWAPPVGQSPTGALCSVAWRGKGHAGVPGSSWPQLAPQAWLTETQEYAQHDVVLMLLGNKVDSAQERAVKREDGEKLAKVSQGRVGGQRCPWGPGLGLSPPGCHLAGSTCLQEYGLPFMETSAKTGLNVDLAFTAIAKELKQRSMKAPSEPRFRLHDYVKREGRSASCCIP
ncbi:ras-related protein Rab-26 isoform X2 [Mustela erminea]|uniref:ras-related protein Rab-26 isoform X2 n=1 Tax=Mustela erminea TaxID=36723 RepID=UPI001386F6D6|nr:ras-related protein Rab-26 isoform X2 [Mustela erminea]